MNGVRALQDDDILIVTRANAATVTSSLEQHQSWRALSVFVQRSPLAAGRVDLSAGASRYSHFSFAIGRREIHNHLQGQADTKVSCERGAAVE